MNLNLTSNLDNIRVIQLLHKNDTPGAPYTITKLYAPGPYDWVQYNDTFQTYSGYSMVIQNRKQYADGAYWVDWIDANHFIKIPGGVYGADFTGNMTVNDVDIMFDSFDGSVSPWTTCTRTGDVPTPTPIPTEIPTPTPTLTPTPTPTPSPTPTPAPTPSPTPITKIFFAPGFGGSWNADALLNCKTTGYSGEWALSPFAKNVYKPLLESLALASWETKPFYYDWRSDIRNNAADFAAYINSNTFPAEKINIVGHSMGGLVGRAYLEALSGGKANKFLAVGTPNQGASIAYPMFSGGEVWTNDLVERIAANLFIKRCGVPASTQNVLPTYDYLRNNITHLLKPLASMSAKNNWLPTDFVFPFWNVKVGTLVGTGFPTLKIIDVVNPSRNDVRNGKWLDGKPVGQEKVNEGDGTVLLQSAQVPGVATNIILNQTHSGLVASTEGISKILEFFGSPGIADPPYSDPTSALVIVGYPGNFWVKDPTGNLTQSENGVVRFFNPTGGNYELQLIPQSGDTLIIVQQILPNNKTLYKEYHLRGNAPKTEVLYFDPKHPSEDILKGKKPEKNWWKFWEKERGD